MDRQNTVDQEIGASFTNIETEVKPSLRSGREAYLETRTDDPDVELERYKSEVKALSAKCERFKQDFKNYRDRVKRDETTKERQIRQSIVTELLSVIDVLDRARNFDLKRREKSGAVKILAGVRENLAMTYNKLTSTLGLRPIDPSPGDMFDGERHVALDIVRSDNFSDNTVVTLIRKGYLFEGKVLRAAEVALSKYTVGGKKRDNLLHGIVNRLTSLFSKKSTLSEKKRAKKDGKHGQIPHKKKNRT